MLFIFAFSSFELSHLRPRAGEREVEEETFPPVEWRAARSNVDWSSSIDGNAGCYTALRRRFRCLNRFSCCDIFLFTTPGFKSDLLDATAILLVRVSAALENKSDYQRLESPTKRFSFNRSHLTPPKLFVPLCPSSITLFSCLLVSVELGAVW